MSTNSTRQRAAITIIGLGPGTFDQLSIGAWRALQEAESLFLRTAVHPTVQELVTQGIQFLSFDALYKQATSFEQLYQEMANQVVAAAVRGPVAYAVPGHPLVAEETVRLIMQEAKRQGLSVTLVPSMSALDAMVTATHYDPIAGLQVYDALTFQPEQWVPQRAAIFLQLYDRFVASQLKLQLLDRLDPETPVTLIRAAGTPDEHADCIPLHDLDRQPTNHLTSLLVPGVPNAPSPTSAHPLDPLTEVMQRLLAPDGCPWDREQTHSTLGRYLIEETYEVIEAIEDHDYEALCEELGDVLLQVVFHAQLATQSGAFTIDDVVQTITTKMKRRHPHVFGTVEAADAAAVLRNWEAIKRAERSENDAEQATQERSLLDGLPRHLPALMLAEKTQKKAAMVGFEWESLDGAWEKLKEEIGELAAAVAQGSDRERSMELGDVLFAIVNVARYLGVDPEAALRQTTGKFARRFRFIEQSAARKGQTLDEMTLGEMDAYWNEAKRKEQP